MGVVAVTTLCTPLASYGLGTGDRGSASAAWVKVGLGLLLLVLAARQGRSRPRDGEVATLPGWMSAIDTLTFGNSASACSSQR